MFQIVLPQLRISICIKYLDIKFLMLKKKKLLRRRMFYLNPICIKGERMKEKKEMHYVLHRGNSSRQTLLNILMV